MPEVAAVASRSRTGVLAQNVVRRKSASRSARSTARLGVSQSISESIEALQKTGGSPLPESVQKDFDERLGQDFSQVRIHTGERPATTARQLKAKAFTVGNDVVFGQGQFAPETAAGKRLIAHELTHVGQQRQNTQRIQRFPNETGIDPMDDPRMFKDGAPHAKTCAIPSWCPAGFCSPFPSEERARYELAKNRGWLLAGIGMFVDSRVVSLWETYLNGGSAPKDLTSQFGADFAASATTRARSVFLTWAIRKALVRSLPEFPATGNHVEVQLSSLIPTAIAALGTPGDVDEMNFDVIGEVAGNIAGGIGKDQTTCSVGARPSPFNDDRSASGTVALDYDPASNAVRVTSNVTFLVQDTIDLCPGDCGALREQIATIPLSQYEATGIAGDVPFTVRFAANIPQFTIPLTSPLKRASAPTPLKPPTLAEEICTVARGARMLVHPGNVNMALPEGSRVKVLSRGSATTLGDGTPTVWVRIQLLDGTNRTALIQQRFLNACATGTP
jgi:hypothetical protein